MSDILPAWAPAAAGKIYERWQFGGEIGRRLLFDPRMEKVWTDLRSNGARQEREDVAAFAERLDDMPNRYRFDTWDLDDEWRTPLAERACVAVFVCSIDRFIVREMRIMEASDENGIEIPITAQAIDSLVERWQNGAKLCREALSSPHRSVFDKELAQALLLCGSYFDEFAGFIRRGTKEGQLYIERKSRALGGDDALRYHVLSIAKEMKGIYGKVYHVPLSEITKVVTNVEIKSKSVENWCRQSEWFPTTQTAPHKRPA
jgi:hypothetical protein